MVNHETSNESRPAVITRTIPPFTWKWIFTKLVGLAESQSVYSESRSVWIVPINNERRFLSLLGLCHSLIKQVVKLWLGFIRIPDRLNTEERMPTFMYMFVGILFKIVESLIKGIAGRIQSSVYTLLVINIASSMSTTKNF